jgi:hypothetical protein
VDVIIASYAVTEHNAVRRVYGWVNDFSSAEFIQLFEKAGFSCIHTEPWRAQVIYKFIALSNIQPTGS